MKSLKVTWSKDGEIVANSSYLDSQLAAERVNDAVSGQMSRDGDSIDGLESRSVSLSLVNLTKADQGIYKCKVRGIEFFEYGICKAHLTSSQHLVKLSAII